MRLLRARFHLRMQRSCETQIVCSQKASLCGGLSCNMSRKLHQAHSARVQDSIVYLRRVLGARGLYQLKMVGAVSLKESQCSKQIVANMWVYLVSFCVLYTNHRKKLARIYRNTRLMVKAGVKNPYAYIGRVHRRA